MTSADDATDDATDIPRSSPSQFQRIRAGLQGWATRWLQRVRNLRRNPAGLAAVASALAALAPILVAAVRTASNRWVPFSDNGILLARTVDVLTSHHPLLGTWTSASVTAGADFNNPGPLLFDILAGPVKLLGYGVGMPVGLAVLNGGSVVGAALAAWRQAGSRAVIPVMAAAAGLAWSMGSELLVDPWQPHAMMLPFFALIVVLWCVVCGDLALVPWFAAVASLLVQTHLSYTFLSILLGLGMVAVIVVHSRRSSEARRCLPRIGVTTVVVVLVLWSQSFVEQLFGDGQGNLGRLLANASSDQSKIGLKLGTRLIADVIVLPGWFSRGSFIDAVPSTPYTGSGSEQRLIVDGVTTFPAAAAAVLAMVTLLALLLWGSIQRRQRPVAAAVGVALALLGTALVAMVMMPSGILGLSPHQLRWLWPMSAFILGSIVTAVVVLATGAARPRRPLAARAIERGGALIGVVVAAAFGVMGSPAFAQPAGPVEYAWSRDSVVAMTEQMNVLEGTGPLLLDDSGLRFAEVYSGAVMAHLQEIGVEFEVENPVLVRQLGEGRSVSGNATARLYLREGQDAVDIPPGVERIVFVPGLTDAELDMRDELTGIWTERLTNGLVTLNQAGEAALAEGRLSMSRAQIDGLDNPQFVVDFGLVSEAAEAGFLEISTAEADQLFRLRDLQRRWRFLTVGIFLAAVESSSGGQ